MIPAKRVPTHPGEILEEEFLKPLGISQVAFAAHLGVPVQRINELVRGKRGVTPETAWLLSQALNTTPEFWLNLQMTFDLSQNRPSREIQALRLAKKTVSGTPGRV
jgi:addiction module HigA family antidote